MRLAALAPCLAGLALAAASAADADETTVAGVAPDLAAAPSLAAPTSEMRIVSGWRAPDGTRVAAIEIRLAPGWHTYWRVPGEAGIPPTFDWSASRNLAAVSYEWPRPEIFETEGMQTFGYEHGLVLPVRLRPVDPTAPMEITLDADLGVCSDICMAARATADLTLAPGTPEEGRPEIEAALADRLRSASESGIVRATCELAQRADGDEITATVTFADLAEPGQVVVIEAGRPDIWIGSSEARTDGRTLTAVAPMEVLGAGGGAMIARDDVRLTLLGARQAIDIHGCEAAG